MQPILRVKNISKDYDGKEVLTGIDFKIMPGEIVGLIGENGSGKTTLLSIIAGLRQQTNGNVFVCGKALNKDGMKYYANIGIALDSMPFYPYMNAVDNLKQYTKNQEKIYELLRTFDLSDAQNRKVSTYSLGMRQRLNIIRSIINDPRLVVMDEPINGLDPKAVANFKEQLKKYIESTNSALLISSHALKELLFFCTKYIFIKDSNIFALISATNLELDTLDAYVDCQQSGVVSPDINEVESFFSEQGIPILKVDKLERIYFSSSNIPDNEFPYAAYHLQKGQTLLENIYLSM